MMATSDDGSLIHQHITPALFCYLESFSNGYRFHLEVELEELINCNIAPNILSEID